MSLFGNVGDPRGLDAGVRSQLAGSLEHILSQASRFLSIDQAAFHSAVDGIRQTQQDPGVFARYFDLIFAINANRFEDANVLFVELIERTSRPVSFAIVPYTRAELGSDYDRFPQLIFAEFSDANPMTSPTDAQAASSKQHLRDAIAIISRIDEDISDEIDAFLTRIYVAAGSQLPSAKRFGGTTSLMAWGGSFVNADVYRTRWDAVQFLVHEITHSLLFSLNSDEPLVQNAPSESFQSPLRPDPRPMDGIFHATLVCARLAAFNKGWLESGLVDAADHEPTQIAVGRNLKRFHEGLAIVSEHGKLSPQARYLIETSRSGLSVLA